MRFSVRFRTQGPGAVRASGVRIAGVEEIAEAVRDSRRAAPMARPTAIEETSREVPPSETKGKVIPLGGASPATTCTCSMAARTVETDNPKAQSAP